MDNKKEVLKLQIVLELIKLQRDLIKTINEANKRGK
nr:MAG TPA: hypothetical protein [Caudoviricetes sp.]